MSKLYIEDAVFQANKGDYRSCGDYYLCRRTDAYSIFVLCDGIGSGIKANIAAIMCATRLMKLFESDISLVRGCEMVLNMMHKARTEDDVPFAAFSVAWILNNGQYTVLSYESPVPIFVDTAGAQPLAQRHFTLGHETISESAGRLLSGQSLLLMTDGLTQAGMGGANGLGWGTKGIKAFVNTELNRGKALTDIAAAAIDKAYLLSGDEHADDTTAVVLSCRDAVVLNVLTGPPASRSDDTVYVEEFMRQDGAKVVCGSTTTDIVARVLNEPIQSAALTTSFTKPPRYSLKGIDIVTEGAVTLNQVYNIIQEEPECYDDSCVSEICLLMRQADIIRFYIGRALNPGHRDISFKQLGVLPRHTIVELLISKLQETGKIVVKSYR